MRRLTLQCSSQGFRVCSKANPADSPVRWLTLQCNLQGFRVGFRVSSLNLLYLANLLPLSAFFRIFGRTFLLEHAAKIVIIFNLTSKLGIIFNTYG